MEAFSLTMLWRWIYLCRSLIVARTTSRGAKCRIGAVSVVFQIGCVPRWRHRQRVRYCQVPRVDGSLHCNLWNYCVCTDIRDEYVPSIVYGAIL